MAYELPNLDIFDDNKGVVLVPQGDKVSAARAIIRLLSDRKFRINMGKEARQSTEIFYRNNNAIDEWNKVFNQTILNKKPAVANPGNKEEMYRRMFQSMLLHYGLGLGLPEAPQFNPGTGMPQQWRLPMEVLRSIENITDQPNYVMHYEGEDLIMVHPINDLPSLGRLSNCSSVFARAAGVGCTPIPGNPTKA